MPDGTGVMALSGRRIVVTGASSGIGRETASLLSQLGARLVLTGRDPERLRESREALEGEGHVVEPLDLSDLSAIPGWFKAVAARTGPVSGLVHCAGVQSFLPVRYLTAGHLEQTLNVNLASAAMLAAGYRAKGNATGGSIVFLSSVSGIVGTAGQAAYSASKGGILALTRTLALELAREGIRVNCLAPGMVRTPMADKAAEALTPTQRAAIEALHPLGTGTPRDVALAAAFLLSDASRWVTGTVLPVDGGYTAA